MAPEFSTSTAYSPGDIVSYKGKIYKFTVAHSAGEWNASHVSEINIADGLIADTDNKLASYSTTTQTASQISSSIANALQSYSTTAQTASSISTAISDALKNYSTTSQTSTSISTAITNALKDYSTTSQTASSISTSITNALKSYSTTSQTATTISTSITDALKSYSTTSQTATTISTSITDALKSYSTTTQTASSISTAITDALKNYSTTTQTANTISTSITNALGSYSTTTQTATNIANYVSSNAYTKQSGVSIAAAGVEITGNKYIKLTSGYIQAGDFRFDSNGLSYTKTISNIAYTGNLKIGQDPTYGTGVVSEFGLNTNSGNANFIMYSGGYSNIELYSQSDSVILHGRKVILYGMGSAASDAHMHGFISVEYAGNNYLRVLFKRSSSGWDTQYGCLGSSSYWWNECWFEYVYYKWMYNQSSRDVKHDIRPIEPYGEKLDQLTPVTFIYNDDEQNRRRGGLIYEDTVDIMPEICCHENGIKSISYVELIPYLLKEIQDLRNRVKQLEQ